MLISFLYNDREFLIHIYYRNLFTKKKKVMGFYERVGILLLYIYMAFIEGKDNKAIYLHG